MQNTVGATQKTTRIETQELDSQEDGAIIVDTYRQETLVIDTLKEENILMNFPPIKKREDEGDDKGLDALINKEALNSVTDQ